MAERQQEDRKRQIDEPEDMLRFNAAASKEERARDAKNTMSVPRSSTLRNRYLSRIGAYLHGIKL